MLIEDWYDNCTMLKGTSMYQAIKMKKKCKVCTKNMKYIFIDLKNILVFINVLKTGPDRPVRPVEPSTGHKTGPVQSKNRFCIEPALNRSNRRSDR